MGGENLASGVVDAQAVDMWYNEIESTNGGLVSAFGMDTGHYTQVVWMETTSLGCGIQGSLLVCQYGPGGNMQGGFERNVLVPSRSREACGYTAPGPAPAPESAPEPPAPSPASSPSPSSCEGWWCGFR